MTPSILRPLIQTRRLFINHIQSYNVQRHETGYRRTSPKKKPQGESVCVCVCERARARAHARVCVCGLSAAVYNSILQRVRKRELI